MSHITLRQETEDKNSWLSLRNRHFERCELAPDELSDSREALVCTTALFSGQIINSARGKGTEGNRLC